MDPHTFSEGSWASQAYINRLQSPSEKVCGSIGFNGMSRRNRLGLPSATDGSDLGEWRQSKAGVHPCCIDSMVQLLSVLSPMMVHSSFGATVVLPLRRSCVKRHALRDLLARIGKVIFHGMHLVVQCQLFVAGAGGRSGV